MFDYDYDYDHDYDYVKNKSRTDDRAPPWPLRTPLNGHWSTIDLALRRC